MPIALRTAARRVAATFLALATGAACVPDARPLAAPATFDCGVLNPHAHITCRTSEAGVLSERTTRFDAEYALRAGAEVFQRAREPRCPILEISCPTFVPEGYRDLAASFGGRCSLDSPSDTTASFHVSIAGEAIRQCATKPGEGTSVAVDPTWTGAITLPSPDVEYEVRVTTTASTALPTCRVVLDGASFGEIPHGAHAAGARRLRGGTSVSLALECDPAPRVDDHDAIGGFAGVACYGYACELTPIFGPEWTTTTLTLDVQVESL